jgi:hypothetical protein
MYFLQMFFFRGSLVSQHCKIEVNLTLPFWYSSLILLHCLGTQSMGTLFLWLCSLYFLICHTILAEEISLFSSRIPFP